MAFSSSLFCGWGRSELVWSWLMMIRLLGGHCCSADVVFFCLVVVLKTSERSSDLTLSASDEIIWFRNEKQFVSMRGACMCM